MMLTVETVAANDTETETSTDHDQPNVDNGIRLPGKDHDFDKGKCNCSIITLPPPNWRGIKRSRMYKSSTGQCSQLVHSTLRHDE